MLGYRDKVARAKLFRQKECDLKNAIESPRISEETKKQLRKLGDEESDNQCCKRQRTVRTNYNPNAEQRPK